MTQHQGMLPRIQNRKGFFFDLSCIHWDIASAVNWDTRFLSGFLMKGRDICSKFKQSNSLHESGNLFYGQRPFTDWLPEHPLKKREETTPVSGRARRMALKPRSPVLQETVPGLPARVDNQSCLR